jgi:serine/threonine-protein kinase
MVDDLLPSCRSKLSSTMKPPKKLGPFKIGRALGHGGMGAVYEGISESNDSVVAIKVLADSLEEGAEDRLRFETEIESLKRLRHPNIVQLSGFGEEQGQLYYVMEFIDGSSLQQELRKRRLFQWYEAAKVGLEIGQALRHAHDRGIIHRDIKPANILLDQQGNIKLSDFGIARFFGARQITDAHSVVGTLEYMSPEQALAHPIGTSTDIFSLGCVLYALLMGKPPFSARSLPELLRKHTEISPVLIHSIRQDVPDDFGILVADLLNIHPDDRPRNARLVTKRLQSILQTFVKIQEIKVLPLPSSDDTKQPANYLLGDAIEPERNHLPNILHNIPPDVPPGDLRSNTFRRIGEKHAAKEMHTVVSSSAAVSTAPDSEPPKDCEKIDLLADTVTVSSTQPPVPAAPPALSVSSGIADTPSPATEIPEQQEDTPVSPHEMLTTLSKSANRFTAVTDKDFELFEEERSRPISLPTIVVSTTLIIVGLIVYYLLQPVPADVLFKRITTAIPERDDTEGYPIASLRSAQNNIDRFLDMYSDHPSADRVRVYKHELDLLEHERRLERRTQFSAWRSLTPVERAYVEILTSAPNNPEHTIHKLRAFIAVFQKTPSASEESAHSHRWTSNPVELCVELARRRLIKLEQEFSEINAEQEQVLWRRLDDAADHAATDPIRAENIRRGIIELYQNHHWAKELVEEAKRQLRE